MKQIFKKYWLLALMFVLVLCVSLLFCGRKSGMFIDEIYTYGLSNSSYAPYVSDIKGGDMIGQVFTRDELVDYVTVEGDEGFDFGSVYYNQSKDVHPPLYYWIFNICSTLFANGFSKWTGLILDLIIYMLALFGLYKLTKRLFGSVYIGGAAVILYGLSLLGLSTMLMIRMYVLLTALTIWLAELIARLMERFSRKDCLLCGLCIFLGLMTQYYYVFYAFFLCAAFLIYLLIKKRGRELLWFVPSAVAGVGCLVLVFPFCLSQLFADKLVSGGSALENLGNFSQYAYRLGYFFSETRHGLKAPIIVALLSVVALVFLFRKLRLVARLGRLRLESLVIILPAFVSFVLVAIISPVADQRYIYNLAPMFVLAVCFLLYLIDRSLWTWGDGNLKTLALLLIAVVALWEARSAPPQYLYPEYREYDAIVEAHCDSPCVYLTDNYFSPVTQDLLQLMAFEDFYVTDEEHLGGVSAYAGDSDELVAYIDISEYWSSGYDAEKATQELLSATGFSYAEPLYQNGLSATYILFQ